MSTYMCMSIISELKSLGGMEPESWFLLKWLQNRNYNTELVLNVATSI